METIYSFRLRFTVNNRLTFTFTSCMSNHGVQLTNNKSKRSVDSLNTKTKYKLDEINRVNNEAQKSAILLAKSGQ